MEASGKYVGVKKHLLKNGDVSYYIGFTNPLDKKYYSMKIGLKSHGITEQYCYNKRSEILNKLRLGEKPTQKLKSKITFDSLAQHYLSALEKSSRSMASTKNEIGRYNLHVKPVFGHVNAYGVTAEDINELIDVKFAEGKMPASVLHIVSMISIIYNHAIKNELYDGKNPAKSNKVKKIKVNNKRERFLDKNEVELLLNDERLKSHPLVDRFVRFSLSTGARLSTVLDIRKKDINIGTRSIVLNNLKSNTVYYGYLANHLLPDLDFLKAMKPNDYVISFNGTKIDHKLIQRKLKAILDDLFNQGLDVKDTQNRVVVHTLRHSFASILAMNGVPLYRIQKLLDHKDAIVTQRYAKLSPDSSFDAVNSMFA